MTPTGVRIFVAIILLASSLPGIAATSEFTVVKVDTRKDRLELFLLDQDGMPFLRLQKLDAWLKSRGETLRFAMNAGMFEPSYLPVGLFVSSGKELAPLNLKDGRGNFYMKPNGVFFVTPAGPRIVESSKYDTSASDVVLATQSGPLLVEHDRIHPSLSASSHSRMIRNGVGVVGNEAVFVISNDAVTLYELASYFRDRLGCADALYFDGVVSSILLPGERRSDSGKDIGPIIGVIQ